MKLNSMYASKKKLLGISDQGFGLPAAVGRPHGILDQGVYQTRFSDCQQQWGDPMVYQTRDSDCQQQLEDPMVYQTRDSDS